MKVIIEERRTLIFIIMAPVLAVGFMLGMVLTLNLIA